MVILLYVGPNGGIFPHFYCCPPAWERSTEQETLDRWQERGEGGCWGWRTVCVFVFVCLCHVCWRWPEHPPSLPITIHWQHSVHCSESQKPKSIEPIKVHNTIKVWSLLQWKRLLWLGNWSLALSLFCISKNSFTRWNWFSIQLALSSEPLHISGGWGRSDLRKTSKAGLVVAFPALLRPSPGPLPVCGRQLSTAGKSSKKNNYQLKHVTVQYPKHSSHRAPFIFFTDAITKLPKLSPR